MNDFADQKRRVRKRLSGYFLVMCSGLISLEMTMTNHLTPKICLLTPYSGKNLGDGAIQEAVISNIRARYPHAVIHAFTIDPAVTERLHSVPCLHLTALSVRNYSGTAPAEIVEPIFSAVISGLIPRIKNIIKKIPYVYRSYQIVCTKAKAVVRFLDECRLVLRGYQMLKGFDLLLVSGGGQLDEYWGGSWGHPFSLLKWGMIGRIAGAKFIFLSVGTCTLESRLSAMFVKGSLRLAAYRSYRDEMSKKLLHHLAFTRNDAVCPDLAFSHEIPAEPDTARRKRERIVVGISPIAYLSSYYWPEENSEIYDSYIQKIFSFAMQLLERKVTVVFYHTSGADKYVVEELVNNLKNNCSVFDEQRVKAVNIETVSELLSLMKNVDYVIASRLHGVILAHLMNVPVLAISYDRKVTTHMSDIDQNEFCIDIHDFKLDLLAEKFSSLTTNSDAARSTISRKIFEFRDKLDLQYNKAFEGLQ